MAELAAPVRERPDIQGEFLSAKEVKDLTGGASGLAEQRKVLEQERIPFKLVRSRLIVSRFHAREWLAGRLTPASRGGVRLDRVK